MKIERFCNRALNYVCLFILGGLALLSFCTSQRTGLEALGEIDNGCPIYWDWDNPFWHLLGIGVILLLIAGCKNKSTSLDWRRSSVKNKFFTRNFVSAVQSSQVAGKAWLLICRIMMTSVSVFLALMLLERVDRTPVDDQIQVYSAAALFSKEIYVNLMPGGYVEMYPQQLGYILYLQLLFKIFGNDSFEYVQVLNCFIIGAIQYTISGIAEQLSRNKKILILTEILSMLFLPLLLLCSWVYGDLPSFLLGLIAARCLLYLIKDGGGRLYKSTLTCVMILLLALAVLLRKNTWIFILAVTIVLCIQAVCKKKGFFILVSVLAISIPALMGKAVNDYYEQKSGYAINGGLPSIMWIAMGMTEGASKPGWFSNFSVPIYYETEYNRELSAERALEQIKKRIDYFGEHPWYAISFYKRKIATQWVDPFLGTEYLADMEEERGVTSIFDYAGGKSHVRIFLSVWQNVLYIGVFLYCVLIGREKSVVENIGLVYFFGGFLFSILWEANSRYVMPYVLFLIPYSAEGWVSFVNAANKYVKAKSKRTV